ncbi:hypothetical protein [Streptomyces sp. NPDC060010]|uniref:hypothetical protein n=1 Tax=Streptomyces sp. NPDC060010 TaxID=3347036 RepID=UPI0036992A6D
MWAAHDAGDLPEALAVAHCLERALEVDLVVDIWSGLRYLARHARDRAAAGGTATVRATIVPITDDLPAELRHPRAYGGTLGSYEVTEPPEVTSVSTSKT